MERGSWGGCLHPGALGKTPPPSALHYEIQGKLTRHHHTGKITASKGLGYSLLFWHFSLSHYGRWNYATYTELGVLRRPGLVAFPAASGDIIAYLKLQTPPTSME